MNQIKTEKEIASMFDSIAGKYDFLNSLLSAKRDQVWRSHMIDHIPSGATVCYVDVATGTGEVIKTALNKGKVFQKIVGTDISPKMLELAADKISAANVSFELNSAMDLDFEDNSVDVLTISFGLRNVVEPIQAIREFARVLKPGGKLLILEFFQPQNSILNSAFVFYFQRVLPKIGGLFSQKSAYSYLPASVQKFMTADELGKVLLDHHFAIDSRRKFLFGNCCFLEATKET